MMKISILMFLTSKFVNSNVCQIIHFGIFIVLFYCDGNYIVFGVGCVFVMGIAM